MQSIARSGGGTLQPARCAPGDFRARLARVPSMTVRRSHRSRLAFRITGGFSRAWLSPCLLRCFSVPAPCTTIPEPCSRVPDPVIQIPCSDSLLGTAGQSQKPCSAGFLTLLVGSDIGKSLCILERGRVRVGTTPTARPLRRPQRTLPSGRLRSAKPLIQKAPAAPNAPNAKKQGRSIGSDGCGARP